MQPESAAMSLDPGLQDRMLKAIPSLRAFACSLCRNRDRADDLLQETLLRAIDRISTFQAGSNLEAWLFTIMRNMFNTEYRKSKRMVQDEDGRLAETLSAPPEQIGWAIARDFRAGFVKLSRDQQQALFLIGAEGLSYDEVAVMAGCETGTVKSRVHRARMELAAFMSGDDVSKASKTSERSSGRRAA
jgi:RNA polymerase sigma-70 factor (ECF subfamily)